MGAFKSTRRRLSILMPIFAQSSEPKEKHGSNYIELLNVRGDEGDNTSRATDDYGKCDLGLK